jgi:hypothetical protein
MPRLQDDDSFDSDDEGVDFSADDSADDATIDCPKCGREISEYAEQCPSCKTYLSDEDAETSDAHNRRRPLWIIIGLVLMLITALTFLLH